ncbi:MAG: DUF4114 domain-containing protein, partial [Deltaproteobacteria bacterium]|nr:DUF4114 domain-containing protein [Deltaproteobacteria bacterium]
MTCLAFRRLALLSCFTLGLALSVSTARAQVSQPTGEVVPSLPGCDGGNPTGLLATFACACDVAGVCNIGAVCPSTTSCDDGMNATCESRMWHVFNDNTCIPSRSDGLDVRADAATTPETFSPTCALTFTVLTRGTARFQNAFGWYNATDPTGPAPTVDDLHLMLACDAAPGDSVVLDVRSDPAYTGGEIGFFLLTPENRTAGGECAGGDCCPTLERLRAGEGYAYYSQADFNPDEGDSPFIHLLTYDSRVSERKFYFAWEDTFNAPNNDFTDLVTSVEGVECAGAGADCDTGMMGACATGVTRCEAGTLSCVATFTGRGESCNGLDDDCNGLVDDDVTCPGEDVCHNGECVPQCAIGVEFACPLVYEECDGDTGICAEPECVGVSCDAGEVCRGGVCASECDGVTCPHGTTCLLDHCVDACEGVSCTAGLVCRGGLCVPGCNQCNGVVCDSTETCDIASGECRDSSCAAACPAGTFCSEGSCVDACTGAVCPRDERCEAGRCVALTPGEDAGVPGVDGGAGGDSGMTGD